ncbi:MAG: gliding motility-associated C-terminal domain-containing protein [Saprospiraceae bacterium]|nr:gliding motility-associated C-terminal domain-containing protein [Saprospiraceae bacterium]
MAQTSACQQAFTLGPDQILCAPQTQTQVQAQCDWDVLNLNWVVSPVPVYVDSATWSVTTTNVETLIASAQIQSPNKIQNGDFSAGNSGFTSSMLYSPFTLFIPGSYGIVSDPSSIHPDFKQCQDHTTGSGLMLACNGSFLGNRDIWCQNVTVEPGGVYDLSFWASALTENESPELVFRIDGQNYGMPNLLGPVTCEWIETTLTWTAGLQTNVQVCIRNLKGANSGNDFALDDIVMKERCTISDTVVVRHVPQKITTLDTLLCAGDLLEVGGVSIVNSGMDTVVLQDQWGCDSTIRIDAFFWDPAIQIQTPDTLDCLLDEVLISADVPGGPGALSFSWTDPLGNVIPGATNPNLWVQTPGNYTLTSSLAGSTGACTVQLMVTVAENEVNPQADAGPDRALTCLTDSVVIGQGMVSPPLIAVWTSLTDPAWGLETGGKLTVGDSGIYQVKVTDPFNGCTALDTVEVNDFRLSLGGLQYDVQAPVCEGDNGLIQFSDLDTGVPPFVLTLEGAGTSVTGGPAFAGLTPGDYLLQVMDANGCMWDTLLTVPETVLPMLGLPQGLTGIAGEQIHVKPVLGFSDSLVIGFTWSAPQLILDCTDCQQVNVSGIGGGILTLCIQFGPDCEICAQTYLKFEDTWYSYVPSAFSPNEDGVNDLFVPILNPEVIQRVDQMEVFDRWGNQQYRWQNDPAINQPLGWNGEIGDRLAPSGVYVYSLQVVLISGKVEKIKGEVQLFR